MKHQRFNRSIAAQINPQVKPILCGCNFFLPICVVLLCLSPVAVLLNYYCTWYQIWQASSVCQRDLSAATAAAFQTTMGATSNIALARRCGRKVLSY